MLIKQLHDDSIKSVINSSSYSSPLFSTFPFPRWSAERRPPISRRDSQCVTRLYSLAEKCNRLLISYRIPLTPLHRMSGRSPWSERINRTLNCRHFPRSCVKRGQFKKEKEKKEGEGNCGWKGPVCPVDGHCLMTRSRGDTIRLLVCNQLTKMNCERGNCGRRLTWSRFDHDVKNLDIWENLPFFKRTVNECSGFEFSIFFWLFVIIVIASSLLHWEKKTIDPLASGLLNLILLKV